MEDFRVVMGELGCLAINNFAMLVRRDMALGGHRMLVLDVDISDAAQHRETK